MQNETDVQFIEFDTKLEYDNDEYLIQYDVKGVGTLYSIEQLTDDELDEEIIPLFLIEHLVDEKHGVDEHKIVHYSEINDISDESVIVILLDDEVDELEVLDVIERQLDETDEYEGLQVYLEHLLIMLDEGVDEIVVEVVVFDDAEGVEMVLELEIDIADVLRHIIDDEGDEVDDDELDEIDANEQLLSDIKQIEVVEYSVLLDEIVYILVEITQFTVLLQIEYLLLLYNRCLNIV